MVLVLGQACFCDGELSYWMSFGVVDVLFFVNQGLVDGMFASIYENSGFLINFMSGS